MCSRNGRPVWVISCLSLVVAVVLAGPAWAVVGYAPDYRGDPNSVHAIFNWVYGQDAWELALFETVSSGYELDGTQPSASDQGEDVTINLPNFIDPLPMKLMRIQLFFDGAVDVEDIEGEINAYDPTGDVVREMVGSSSGSAALHYFDFMLIPNPDYEQIIMYANVDANVVPGNLLTIEIDTVSLPEPATLGLLSLGGLLAVLRRRRGHSARP